MRSESFSVESLDRLQLAIADTVGTSNRRFIRNANLAAISFEPRNRRQSVFDDTAVELENIQAVMMTYRIVTRAWMRRRVAVSIHTPHVDLPGSGRITWAGQIAFDAIEQPGRHPSLPRKDSHKLHRTTLALAEAMEDNEPVGEYPRVPQFYYAFHRNRNVVCEPQVDPVAWREKEIAIGMMRAWPAEFFVRPYDARFDKHPVNGTPNPWAGENPSQDDAVDGWVLRDGVSTPEAQRPDAIYAYMTDFRGRQARNPAYHVLRARGVLQTPYVSWSRRYLQPEGLPPGLVERHHAALAEYANADDAAAAQLVADVKAMSLAFGIPLPDDHTAAEWLSSPWVTVEVPRSSGVQVIRLTDRPSAETLTFAWPEQAFDFYHIGNLFETVPAHNLREARRQFHQSRSRQCHQRSRHQSASTA